MTLLQAFQFKAGNGISDTDAATVLEFAGLNPNAEWVKDGPDHCKFYDALLGYLEQDNVGVRSISEGGYTIVYDRAGKGKYLNNLANESGCAALTDKYGLQPQIRDKSNLW